MTIIAIGIDLAKNVFAVHGVDEAGKASLVRSSVKRDALLELVAKLARRLHQGRFVWPHGEPEREVSKGRSSRGRPQRP